MSFARERVMIVGGAGFLGSHFTDALIADERTLGLTLYDNFSSDGNGITPSTRTTSDCESYAGTRTT